MLNVSTPMNDTLGSSNEAVYWFGRTSSAWTSRGDARLHDALMSLRYMLAVEMLTSFNEVCVVFMLGPHTHVDEGQFDSDL